MNLKDARSFVARFVKGEYTPEEYATFLRWLQDASIDELGIIADEHEALFEQWSLAAVAPSPEWVGQLEQKLDEQERLAPVKRLNTGRVVRRPMWIAAASVLLAVTGGYLWYNHSIDKQAAVADNPVIALNKVFSVARGGQQQEFTLADGSKIWLNAASTLKYPASFSGSERTVELTGEAYFEVTGSAARPFHVKIKGAEIEVLGTHFNVKAYGEESSSKTTLVDGAVKVIRGTETLQLKPGEQAEIVYPTSGANPPMKLQKGVDIDHVLSWKSGDLEFKDDALSNVMQAISRCYDVEIRYQSGIPEARFTGNFSRQSNIQQILNQLEHQNIHCSLQGKVVTVLR
ncbi:FecR domain-containing protein [Flavitalea sp. BT771]|uniref:FecR family protein n=1 Tax=Flavitalea sp. BT771 TaxID=3063329 RepID=UPI0026E18289|nr:FecR family protein [Flavitalea sp. BT771]MDO6432272.1 FecR domain-containing protein [Flavitalea sp. BT771]MDV6221182.1 FecR domain-containing protein [Flavitalea sp. BT771]